MKERIIENWLDKASERSIQQPFCHMLAANGHIIIHSTRHSEMELGKDIITIDKYGATCLFQLKNTNNGRITISQWRKDLNSQVLDLATLPPVHPSIDADNRRKAFLVVNGQIDEAVSRAIDDLNSDLLRRNIGCNVSTIVRGQLYEMACNLENNLWPSELSEFNLFLNFFLKDGKGNIDKKDLSNLFESIFKLENNKNIPRPQCLRRISSASLLCSLCLTNYSNEDNSFAEIEAWTIYISYVFSFIEKHKIPFSYIQNDFNIAFTSIKDSLTQINKELKDREHIIEGDILSDQPVFRFRVNILISLMSLFWIWRRYDGIIEDKSIDGEIHSFINRYKSKILFWGEAAIPQFLSYYWFFRKTDATPAPDFFLYGLIKSICSLNKLRSERALPNPYYQAEDLMPYLFGFANIPLDDSFDGMSFSIEGLLHLFTRKLWKQRLKLLWPEISKINIEVFEYKYKYHFYRWNNREGSLKSIFFKSRQDWKELSESANENSGISLPPTIKKFPVLLLLFLIVYPHRMNADNLRWLDTQLSKVNRVL